MADNNDHAKDFHLKLCSPRFSPWHHHERELSSAVDCLSFSVSVSVIKINKKKFKRKPLKDKNKKFYILCRIWNFKKFLLHCLNIFVTQCTVNFVSGLSGTNYLWRILNHMSWYSGIFFKKKSDNEMWNHIY